MQYIIGTLFILLMMVTLWVILQIIASWQIFNKAGEAGWKSLIPIYSTYVLYRISWNTSIFWIMLLIGTVAGGLNANPDNDLFVLAARGFSFLSVAIGCINLHKLSKAFGHGIGFSLGLIFLNPIFMLILGFDSSRYIGKEN